MCTGLFVTTVAIPSWGSATGDLYAARPWPRCSTSAWCSSPGRAGWGSRPSRSRLASWPRAARYDLVIVDAPATGHGVATMRAPKTFADIARVGPIANQGRAIHAMITDPESTGVVAVALPEEMPVNETLSLRDSLRSELGLGLDRVVVNGLYERRFGARHA